MGSELSLRVGGDWYYDVSADCKEFEVQLEAQDLMRQRTDNLSIQAQRQRHVLLIAGGIGVGPLQSMLEGERRIAIQKPTCHGNLFVLITQILVTGSRLKKDSSLQIACGCLWYIVRPLATTFCLCNGRTSSKRSTLRSTSHTRAPRAHHVVRREDERRKRGTFDLAE